MIRRARSSEFRWIWVATALLFLASAVVAPDSMSGTSLRLMTPFAGVLAIAATRLGASRVVAIDHDPDALQSARENLALNPDSHRTTTFVLADLMAQPLALPSAHR